MRNPERAIYLDNNATTQVAPEVIEAVHAAMEMTWGNPSSRHAFGLRANALVEEARLAVMRLLGARSPGEILFTSGGTESINTAIHAALAAAPAGRRRILTSTVEHSAVRQSLAPWRESGFEVTEIAVDHEGRLDVEACLAALDSGVALVTVQLANNETGALTETEQLARIGEAARASEVPFHLDAVQGPGKVPLAVGELGCDFLSISGHKFHGPKGVGALWVRPGAAPLFHPLVRGGPQEDERRGGTQNVPGIAGIGRAADLAREWLADGAGARRVRELRDRLESRLLGEIEGARLHAKGAPRLDNTVSVFVPGVEGELLLSSLDAEGLAVSGGAACSSRTKGPSPVLLAMGYGEEEASGTLRLSLSRLTTAEEIERAADVLGSVVQDLRGLFSA
ncbi:MAG TPA: cysteine desulfurase [Planctomycetes bacterium]|nr:cysteine desulfurase [Planctomycetota bacterium]